MHRTENPKLRYDYGEKIKQSKSFNQRFRNSFQNLPNFIAWLFFCRFCVYSFLQISFFRENKWKTRRDSKIHILQIDRWDTFLRAHQVLKSKRYLFRTITYEWQFFKDGKISFFNKDIDSMLTLHLKRKSLPPTSRTREISQRKFKNVKKWKSRKNTTHSAILPISRKIRLFKNFGITFSDSYIGR